jgi:DNA repair ATPase RecN
MELEYIEQVGHIAKAAAEVESGSFELDGLGPVAERDDSLGQLARVFQKMAREVYAREERLKQQVQKLQITIDDVKKDRQVAEITETEYFKSLRDKADRLRERQGTAENVTSDR